MAGGGVGADEEFGLEKAWARSVLGLELGWWLPVMVASWTDKDGLGVAYVKRHILFMCIAFSCRGTW